MIELAIKISNSEQKYVQKFLSYDPIFLSKDDITLAKMVQVASENFKGNIEDIDINVKMVW